MKNKDEKGLAYDKECKELEATLAPLLTEEFLDVLVIAVKTCGYSVDNVESSDFVRWCFDVVDKECPTLEPYQNP